MYIYYRYHIEFSVPWNTCVHPERKVVAAAIIAENHNPNCYIVDLAQEKDGLKYKIYTFFYKIKFQNYNNSNYMEMVKYNLSLVLLKMILKWKTFINRHFICI